MVFQKLDPPFGHRLRRDAQDGEARLAKLPNFVLDRPREVNRIIRLETLARQPRLCRLPVADAERNQVQADMARCRSSELPCQLALRNRSEEQTSEHQSLMRS